MPLLFVVEDFAKGGCVPCCLHAMEFLGLSFLTIQCDMAFTSRSFSTKSVLKVVFPSKLLSQEQYQSNLAFTSLCSNVARAPSGLHSLSWFVLLFLFGTCCTYIVDVQNLKMDIGPQLLS
jgi:hypothetical protein